LTFVDGWALWVDLLLPLLNKLLANSFFFLFGALVNAKVTCARLFCRPEESASRLSYRSAWCFRSSSVFSHFAGTLRRPTALYPLELFTSPFRHHRPHLGASHSCFDSTPFLSLFFFLFHICEPLTSSAKASDGKRLIQSLSRNRWENNVCVMIPPSGISHR
jgi:hypothetical protein